MSRMKLDYIKTTMIPKIVNEGRRAMKTAAVEALQWPNDKPLVVETWVGDKLETTNTANKGDYILRNPGGERYVVTADVFNSTYELIGEKSWMNVPLARKKESVYVYPCSIAQTIETDWGTMETSRGGYYATDGKSMWFIDGEKFHETYNIIEE